MDRIKDPSLRGGRSRYDVAIQLSTNTGKKLDCRGQALRGLAMTGTATKIPLKSRGIFISLQ